MFFLLLLFFSTSVYFLPLFMPCYLRKMHIYIYIYIIFFFLIYECGNLNAENKMRDMGKRTYLIVENSGLVIRKFLKEHELEDACRRCTHCRLGIFGKLINECELEGRLSSVHPL